jgi:hypothetical protein
MTPQEIITDARSILGDTDTAAPRNSDTELLRAVHDGLQEIAQFKPSAFSDLYPFTCVAGVCEQVVDLDDANSLLDVVSIHNGAGLTPFDRATMDMFRPSWRTDAPGPGQQWAPVESDAMRFYVYPAPLSGQVIDLRVARNPGTYGLADQILYLPESYKPALVDYVIYKAELKDDESVLTQRSAAMYMAFLKKIGVPNASGAQ